jgi:hypothetical protein
MVCRLWRNSLLSGMAGSVFIVGFRRLNPTYELPFSCFVVIAQAIEVYPKIAFNMLLFRCFGLDLNIMRHWST